MPTGQHQFSDSRTTVPLTTEGCSTWIWVPDRPSGDALPSSGSSPACGVHQSEWRADQDVNLADPTPRLNGVPGSVRVSTVSGDHRAGLTGEQTPRLAHRATARATPDGETASIVSREHRILRHGDATFPANEMIRRSSRSTALARPTTRRRRTGDRAARRRHPTERGREPGVDCTSSPRRCMRPIRRPVAGRTSPSMIGSSPDRVRLRVRPIARRAETTGQPARIRGHLRVGEETLAGRGFAA